MKFSLDLTVIQDNQLKPFDCILFSVIDSLSQNAKFKLPLSNLTTLMKHNKLAIVNSLNNLSKTGYITYNLADKNLLVQIISETNKLKAMQINQTKLKQVAEVKKANQKEHYQKVLTLAKTVLDYLNQKVDKNFRYTTKKYQELISGLMNKGYQQSDFIQVIDNKYAKWKNTEYIKYMRPTTLFTATHFDEYLNEVKKQSKAEVIKQEKARKKNSGLEGWE